MRAAALLVLTLLLGGCRLLGFGEEEPPPSEQTRLDVVDEAATFDPEQAVRGETPGGTASPLADALTEVLLLVVLALLLTLLIGLVLGHPVGAAILAGAALVALVIWWAV